MYCFFYYRSAISPQKMAAVLKTPCTGSPSTLHLKWSYRATAGFLRTNQHLKAWQMCCCFSLVSVNRKQSLVLSPALAFIDNILIMRFSVMQTSPCCDISVVVQKMLHHDQYIAHTALLMFVWKLVQLIQIFQSLYMLSS